MDGQGVGADRQVVDLAEAVVGNAQVAVAHDAVALVLRRPADLRLQAHDLVGDQGASEGLLTIRPEDSWACTRRCARCCSRDPSGSC